MSDKQVKFHVPPGTIVTAIGSVVQVIFMCEQDADNFCGFLQWLNDPKNHGKELQVGSVKEKIQ